MLHLSNDGAQPVADQFQAAVLAPWAWASGVLPQANVYAYPEPVRMLVLSGTMAVLTCMQLVQAKDQQRERGLRLLLAAQERAAAAAASAESDEAAVAAAEAEMNPPSAAKVSFRPAKDVPAVVCPVSYYRQAL